MVIWCQKGGFKLAFSLVWSFAGCMVLTSPLFLLGSGQTKNRAEISTVRAGQLSSRRPWIGTSCLSRVLHLKSSWDGWLLAGWLQPTLSLGSSSIPDIFHTGAPLLDRGGTSALFPNHMGRYLFFSSPNIFLWPLLLGMPLSSAVLRL